MLAALEPAEHDFQEFKGALFLADGRNIVSSFTNNLSRQVSAFANGAGGRIFLGLDDDGRVDGGIPVDLKGGGTRAWLEDVIPGTVDPPLRKFNGARSSGPDTRSTSSRLPAARMPPIKPSTTATTCASPASRARWGTFMCRTSSSERATRR